VWGSALFTGGIDQNDLQSDNKLEVNWQGHWPIKDLGGRRSLEMIVLRKRVLRVANQMFGVTKQI